MLTENTKKVQIAPTTGIRKAFEVVMKKMKKKWTMPYIMVKYSGNLRKVKLFIKVITLRSTLLLKLNFLFQLLICKVNEFDLKQYFF